MKKQMLWQIMMPCLIAILMLVLMMPIYYFSYQNARQMAVDHASSRIQTGISNLSTLISMHNTNLYELSTSKEVRSFMKKVLPGSSRVSTPIITWQILTDFISPMISSRMC